MKIAAANLAFALSAGSFASAFVPQHQGRAFATKSSGLDMSAATETPTYTFAKSEEIFAEAKEVGVYTIA